MPDEISGSFTKRDTAWYDDDYISQTGQKRNYNDDAGDGSYYQMNDDGSYGADDGNYNNHYVNNNDDVKYNYMEHDDGAC